MISKDLILSRNIYPVRDPTTLPGHMNERTCYLTVLILGTLVLLSGCTGTGNGTGSAGITTTYTTTVPVSAGEKLVRLETNMGNITIALAPDMPVTTGNFEALVKAGYYNGVIFHRVIDGFMIQGGDPTGTGRGGPGYTIKDEFTDHNQNSRGTISMANAGPDTGGSQFFINLVDNNNLNSKHPVFGRVTEGMDVVDLIGKVKTGPGNRPLQDVVIIRAVMV